MSRFYKTILMAAFLALVLRFPVFADNAMDLKQQIDQRNQEIQQLEKEIQQYQGGIDAAESAANTLKSEITKLNLQIKQLNAKISLAQKKIAAKELEIRGLGENISDTETSIAERKAALGKILQGLNDAEKESLLEALLKYNSVSDFFGELEKIQSLGGSVKENHDELQALDSELKNKKQAAETAQKDLKNLKNDLLAQRAIQNNTKSEKTDLLAATKNQETLYQKLLADRERRRQEIYAEIQLIENQLKQQINLGTLPAFAHGILAWPVDNPVVTQGFGMTTFSQYTDVYGGHGHNGIDLRASVGTPVRAADDGAVRATGNADIFCPHGSYGRWILIEHPNKLATLYAHLSLILVASGQQVGRGDVIGYSGSSGYVTGPHLHFTVYDARTVELRQSRVCGILPFGGYLNPLNYL